MRRQMVEAKTKKAAAKLCPWAAVIIKIEGGYVCFESSGEAKAWQKQR